MSDRTPARGPRSWDWAGVLYNLMMTLAAPALLAWAVARLVRSKARGGGGGVPPPLGWLPPAVGEPHHASDPVIWVHAASVGEVTAASAVLRELRLRLPLAHIVLSTSTPTGQSSARQRDLGVDAIFQFPVDAPLIMERLLECIKPSVLVLVETEIWPNLLWLARRRGTRTAIINGRISDRAFPRNRTFRFVFRWALRNVDWIGAQSPLDAERFVLLGADPAAVTVGGNSKFDEVPVRLLPAEAARWRQEFGFAEGDEILLAGSTHPGEEEAILTIFDHLRFSHKRLQLIIAPRHPDRGDRVHQLVREHGYDVYRRSHVLQMREDGGEMGVPGAAAVRVVIIDTIGELGSIYGCADLVIVAGSLLHGLAGHNLLEPIAQGKMVLFGRYCADFRDISAVAVREGCGVQVQSIAELQEQCDRLLNAPEERAQAAERGARMLSKYAGASARYAQVIAEMAEPPAGADVAPSDAGPGPAEAFAPPGEVP